MRLFGRLLVFFAGLTPPLLAVWLGSSLASYLGGPRWAALGCGLLLCPVLPAAWELGAVRRRNEARRARRWSLQATLAWRTIFLSVLAIAFLLAWWPAASFLALSTRGDWFLDANAPGQAWASRGLRATAGVLEGLWRAATPDPYAEWRRPLPPELQGTHPTAASIRPAPAEPPCSAQTPKPPPPPPRPALPAEPPPTPPPSPPPARRLCATLEDGTPVCVDAEEPPTPPPAIAAVPPAARAGPPSGRVTELTWPLPNVLHPAVVELEKRNETSIAEVARRLSQGSTRGADRVKALHDWVASRIAYDAEALREMKFPPQDETTVFTRRTAVCAGYARLLSALGDAAGEHIVYLVGQARGPRGLEGHAWNAAEIDGTWTLIDATWDSGTVSMGNTYTFAPRYQTSYLFMPPASFARMHLPNDEAWQLLATPMKGADFMAAANILPAGDEAHLDFLKPDRCDVETSGAEYQVEFRNPLRRDVLARICPQSGECLNCRGRGPVERLQCPLPHPGEWALQVFVARRDESSKADLAMKATLRAR